MAGESVTFVNQSMFDRITVLGGVPVTDDLESVTGFNLLFDQLISLFNSTTLPLLTTLARNALIPANGDQILNTDRNRVETWQGAFWVNSDLVVLTNATGAATVAGQVVKIQKLGGASSVVLTAAFDEEIIGVVVDSGANGAPTTIATSGIYDVNFGVNVAVIGEFMTSSAVAGTAETDIFGSPGTFGQILTAGAGLQKGLILPREIF